MSKYFGCVIVYFAIWFVLNLFICLVDKLEFNVPFAIIAFDELQKKLYAEKAPENDAPKEKTHQPILIAVFMFALAAIVIGGEYLL